MYVRYSLQYNDQRLSHSAKSSLYMTGNLIFKDDDENMIPNTKSNYSLPGKAPKTPDSELTPSQVGFHFYEYYNDVLRVVLRCITTDVSDRHFPAFLA